MEYNERFGDFKTCLKKQKEFRKAIALPSNDLEDRRFCRWFFEFVRLKEF